jgi:hypothetical protein
MNKRKILSAILLGMVFSVLIPFAVPSVVSAQTCIDPTTGAQIACPSSGDKVKVKKKKPTATPYPSFTLTPTTPPIATLTSEVLQLLPPSNGGGTQKPSSGLPGGFDVFFGGLIIVVLIGSGFLLLRRFRESPTKPVRESPSKFVRESPSTPGEIDWGDKGADQGLASILNEGSVDPGPIGKGSLGDGSVHPPSPNKPPNPNMPSK